jgi:hypothetical protein
MSRLPNAIAIRRVRVPLKPVDWRLEQREVPEGAGCLVGRM